MRALWSPGAALCAALLVSGCARLPGSPAGETNPLRAALAKRDRFRAVDVLHYRGKPDVSELGMLPGIGTPYFWRPGDPREQLDEQTFRAGILPFKDYIGLFFIELEMWPVCFAPDSVLDQTVVKLGRALDLAREVAPNVAFGIYSELPAPAYWPVVSNDTLKLRQWRSCNRRLAPLARKVDVIMPSLYTFYEDEAGWDAYAKATLEAARAYGKPVYPFLWPEYHDSNPQLVGKEIPGRVWRHQLELVRHEADGVVLWNGFQRPWNAQSDWWIQTREFLNDLKSSDRLRPGRASER